MSNNIHFFTEGVAFTISSKGNLVKWIRGVIEEKNKIIGVINFIITNDVRLQKINIKYLNNENLTDVISFTLSEEDDIISGDIYLSIERVRENARKYKCSEEEEFKRILIHGIFHLMGYDDKTRGEKRKMTNLENKYLEASW